MKLNVKQLTIIVFTLLCIVSGYHYGYGNVIWQIIVAVSICLITNLLIEYSRTGKLIVSESAIITGLIIAMVAAPKSPVLEIAILSMIAIVSKFLIKTNNRTVFNPAALSLLIGVLVFNLPLGWWADYNHFLTIIAGSLLLIKYNGHWKMIYAFLITLIVFIIIHSLFLGLTISDELYFKIGISFFFTFFMLTDPRTTPLMADQFITFGIITSVGTFLSMLFFPSTTFIGGLLVANLITPYLNNLSMQKIKARIPVKIQPT